MVKETHIENEKTLLALQKLAAVLLFVAQIAFALLFISGVIEVKGITVGLWGAIDLVLGSFKRFGTVSGITLYTWVFSVGLGILYVVFLVLILKRFFSSIKSLSKILSSPLVDGKQKEDRLLYLNECFGTSFFNIITFIVIARIGFAFSLSNSTFITLIVGGAVYVIARFCFYLSRNRNFVKSLLGLATDLLLLSCMFLFMYLCTTTTVLEIFKPLKFVFQSFSIKAGGILYSLFTYIVYPIFQIILYILGLKLLNNMLSYSDNRSTVHYYSEKIFKTALILFAVAVIVVGYERHLSDFWGTLKILKPYFSIALLATVCRLNFTFPEYHRLDQVAQPDQPDQEEKKESIE